MSVNRAWASMLCHIANDIIKLGWSDWMELQFFLKKTSEVMILYLTSIRYASMESFSLVLLHLPAVYVS